MHHFLLIYLFIITIILGQHEVDINNLLIKDGIYYQPLDVKPYTGRIIDLNEEGNIILETNCNRGKINGSWMAWYDNGKKKYEGSLDQFIDYLNKFLIQICGLYL